MVVSNGNGGPQGSGTLVNWSLIWADEADEKKIYRMKCSVCLADLKCGVVFPEPGLRLCLKCLSEIHDTAINNLKKDSGGKENEGH
ncbi:MAG: hypothetical protein AM326_03365 [Candidatus Thorarchaeota archaeon SMTZ-45]|nr:MAG: hypothetical protein AM326_03365 [Candidatus Thorarchaeota archaeon SMTZ-45]